MTAPAIVTLRPPRQPRPTASWGSSAAGFALTALLVLLLALGFQPRVEWLDVDRVAPGAAAPERLTYVDVPPVPLAPPAEPVADGAASSSQSLRSPAPALPLPAPSAIPAAPARPRVGTPVPPVARPDSVGAAGGSRALPRARDAQLPTGITFPPAAPARRGAPAEPCVGPCLDAARAGVDTRAAPLSRAERDSALRAIGQSVPALARELERRDRHMAPAAPPKDPGAIPILGGTSISVGLPGGGPSKAQRERDRKAHAENSLILARIKARQDSLARADSLERARRRAGGRPPE